VRQPLETNDALSIRRAGLQDIPALVQLRREMFEAMGFQDAAALDASDLACEHYFHETIRAGRFHGWVAVTDDGTVVASGGLVIDRHPPGPDNLSGQIGYVMSLSTEPAFRRRGLAKRIMQAMLSALREWEIPAAALHATDAGRPLYTALGFQDSNEMRLFLQAGGEGRAEATTSPTPRRFR
jgi:GNAT superfamily N-acetyltransferase